jgi:two-component system OmpR family response regulator
MSSNVVQSAVEALRVGVDWKVDPILEAGSRPTASRHGPLKALCVDDNVDAADSLAAVIELLGCDARVCYSGAAALHEFGAYHPDACFLDLMMPGMDGLEVAAQIRSIVGASPVFLVAVTGLGSLEDRTKTAVTGFHYHLMKPVDATTLANLINDIHSMLPNRRQMRHPNGQSSWSTR